MRFPDSVGKFDFENNRDPAAFFRGRRIHQETVIDFGEVKRVGPGRSFQKLVSAPPFAVHCLDDGPEVLEGWIGIDVRVVRAQMVEHRLVGEAIPAVRDSTAVVGDCFVFSVVASGRVVAGVTT